MALGPVWSADFIFFIYFWELDNIHAQLQIHLLYSANNSNASLYLKLTGTFTNSHSLSELIYKENITGMKS